MRLLAVLLLLAAPAWAQDQRTGEGIGALLRWLDKMSGETADVELQRGQSAVSGHLTIELDECRFPAGDPASDAYAHLTIRDSRAAEPVFDGWMIASSPALSALDHPRYDVWLLRCTTEAGSAQ
ncbi:DUF2155 domain-containing protein [Cereibacter sphaeroides]|uniref:DUF2155 domain-containing protein n=1 Tax=Cereibacter sphaeroides TaxID=1063 RepID=UPI00313EC514